MAHLNRTLDTHTHLMWHHRHFCIEHTTRTYHSTDNLMQKICSTLVHTPIFVQFFCLCVFTVPSFSVPPPKPFSKRVINIHLHFAKLTAVNLNMKNYCAFFSPLLTLVYSVRFVTLFMRQNSACLLDFLPKWSFCAYKYL